MNKQSRIFLLIAVLGLLGGLLCIVGRGPRGKELQKYKASLRAKGEALTYRELPHSQPTNAHSSVMVLMDAVGELSKARYQPESMELRRYVSPGHAQVLWRAEEAGWTGSRGRTQYTWVSLGADLEKFSKPISELQESLKDPPPDWGPRSNILAGPTSNFITIRRASQWLAASALWHARKAQLEPALNDLEALIALSRMNREEYTLVAQMIRVAVANLGCSATWEALQVPGWTADQLDRLQHAWQPMDLVQAVEAGLVGERAMGAELWGLVRQRNGRQKLSAIMAPNTSASGKEVTWESFLADYVTFPAYKLTGIDDDELFHLRTMQESIEAVRQLRTNRPWHEVKRELDQPIARLNGKASSLARFRYWLSLMSIPYFSKAVDTGIRTETERRMTVAAIALKRFALAHNQPPATLEALVPTFLDAVPIDPMSGRPLGYRLKDDGTWILYSVGEDSQDDGGDPGNPSGGNPGLWNGRDAVWPSPAP